MEVFGKAKFTTNKRNWFKLKDGDNVYRILPPMGELAEEGRWSQFYSVHYGYKNSKNEMRTFVSPLVKNPKTRMIEVPDAALERINELTSRLEKAKKEKNEELVAQLLKLVGGPKSRYNLDSNHYMNVVDLQGNIGILKIRHKAKLALDAAIKKLRDSGVEPLDPENGRFFVFTRSGSARDTIYQVTVYKKKLNVEGVGLVEQDVVHTITDEIAKRCVTLDKNGRYLYKEAANLTTLFKKPTSEQVERIVKEGEKAVDEILDARASRDTEETNYSDDTEVEEEVSSAPVTKSASAPAATPTVTATTSTATHKTSAETISELTDEDFLKSLGL